MTDDPLLVERRGHVALLTFNRPEKLNALSSPVRRAFLATLSLLSEDYDVRVVVLTEAGRAFSAALDLAEIAASAARVEDNVAGEDLVAAIQRSVHSHVGIDAAHTFESRCSAS